MDLIPRKIYLDDFFDNFVSNRDNDSMKCDIYEKDGDYHIELDIPGFDKKEIQIEAKNGYLTVTAEKQNEDNDATKNYIRRERSYGKYTRSFYLGDLESDKVDATFTDGILKIVIPKKEEVENKKYIEIK